MVTLNKTALGDINARKFFLAQFIKVNEQDLDLKMQPCTSTDKYRIDERALN